MTELRLGCRTCNLPISDEEDRANNGHCDACEHVLGNLMETDEDYDDEC